MLPPKAWRFIGLNAIRALSLISLILVLASNIVVMVDDVNAVREADNSVPDPEDADLPLCDYIEGSTVPNQAGGPFWAVLNRILILIQVIFLIFSEIGWPDALFVRILPILSGEYGVGPIGLLECLIGAQVLSHHVDPFPMVAAFFLFSIGCLNIIIALIFGKAVKSHRSIFSWRERIPKSAADLAKTAGVPSPIVNVASSVASSIFNEKDPERNSSQESFNGYGFGRQGEKAAGLKGFLLSKPADVLPKYAPRIHTSRHSSPTGSPISMPGRF